MLELVLPKIECSESSETYGRFVIEPLEAGFGLTLGNALRRVLLSSLQGTAITSVKIDGVQHEFSSIPSVREDTTEFLLNAKAIRLRSYADRPAKLTLDVSGQRDVRAGDVMAPADLEVVNPEQHLATLDSADARLTVEFTVERGKGYLPAGSREGLPIGVIPVDAIFTPTRKVNYRVEHTRIGQVTNYDRLILEVWTDGTMTPQEAVSQSSKILVGLLNLFTDLAKAGPGPVRVQPAGGGIPKDVYNTPIEELDLSVRAYNCLKRSGITKVGQVLDMTEDDLLAVRNFGRKSLDELRERLEAKGFLQMAAGSPLVESFDRAATGAAPPSQLDEEGFATARLSPGDLDEEDEEDEESPEEAEEEASETY
ncbi:MAG: DNA-directed RNA polymerase subunit alpha [Chloroflexi bacterium]|nr:DNA-directed RNA polymerase subunit alpha [Chloroflexota bacterium]